MTPADSGASAETADSATAYRLVTVPQEPTVSSADCPYCHTTDCEWWESVLREARNGVPCGRCGKGDRGDHDWDCLDGSRP